MTSQRLLPDLAGGPTGLTGLVAGMVFKRIWRRSPAMALAMGAAYFVFRALQASQQAKAGAVSPEAAPAISPQRLRKSVAQPG
jgi:hypothetical protein